jgi:hypothetical protein
MMRLVEDGIRLVTLIDHLDMQGLGKKQGMNKAKQMQKLSLQILQEIKVEISLKL